MPMARLSPRLFMMNGMFCSVGMGSEHKLNNVRLCKHVGGVLLQGQQEANKLWHMVAGAEADAGPCAFQLMHYGPETSACIR